MAMVGYFLVVRIALFAFGKEVELIPRRLSKATQMPSGQFASCRPLWALYLDLKAATLVDRIVCFWFLGPRTVLSKCGQSARLHRVHRHPQEADAALVGVEDIASPVAPTTPQVLNQVQPVPHHSATPSSTLLRDQQRDPSKPALPASAHFPQAERPSSLRTPTLLFSSSTRGLGRRLLEWRVTRRMMER